MKIRKLGFKLKLYTTRPKTFASTCVCKWPVDLVSIYALQIIYKSSNSFLVMLRHRAKQKLSNLISNILIHNWNKIDHKMCKVGSWSIYSTYTVRWFRNFFFKSAPPQKKTPQSVRCYLLQWKWSLLKDVSQYKFLLKFLKSSISYILYQWI